MFSTSILYSMPLHDFSSVTSLAGLSHPPFWCQLYALHQRKDPLFPLPKALMTGRSQEVSFIVQITDEFCMIWSACLCNAVETFFQHERVSSTIIISSWGSAVYKSEHNVQRILCVLSPFSSAPSTSTSPLTIIASSWGSVRQCSDHLFISFILLRDSLSPSKWVENN